MKHLIIIIISIVILSFLTVECNKYEHLTTFNGLQSVDDQYYSDRAFDNVIYYPNEYNKDYKSAEEIGELVERGIDKCYKECNGTCMEFGVHGVAHCFEPIQFSKANSVIP